MNKRWFSAIAITMLLAACASEPPMSATLAAEPTAAASATPAPASGFEALKTLTHNDLKAAAKYATDNGYPARAAMWTAIEQQLTAAEGQVAACKAAIEAAKPKLNGDTPTGLALLAEMGAEAVARGISASVKANCEPIVIPGGLLPIPKL